MTPFHGTKLLLGIEDNVEIIYGATTEEEVQYHKENGFREVKMKMMTDSERTSINWASRGSSSSSGSINSNSSSYNTPAASSRLENTSSSVSSSSSSSSSSSGISNSSNTSVISSISGITSDVIALRLPALFTGIKPFTAEKVIEMYEKGDAQLSPMHLWTSEARNNAWGPNFKKSSNNFYNTCQDYVYLQKMMAALISGMAIATWKEQAPSAALESSPLGATIFINSLASGMS
jgi:hypothetical protein